MAGTWPTFRDALVAQLDGVEWKAEAQRTETLKAFRFVTKGRQDAKTLPCAYPLPFTPEVVRTAGGQLVISGTVTVRLLLGGPQDNLEAIHQRYEACWVAVVYALDDFVAGDAAADYSHDQTISPLVRFEDIDQGWGFEIEIPIRISETREFSG